MSGPQPKGIYAVRADGRWFVASPVAADKYGAAAVAMFGSDARVWSALETTALICGVGEEEACKLLDVIPVEGEPA